MPITVKTSEGGRKMDIAISGRFDFSVHQEFREAYAKVDPRQVSFCIDLSQTEYMDSAALGMLLVLKERAGDERADITLKGCQPTVQQIMEITRFGELFKIVP